MRSIFENTTGSDIDMLISVKELLSLEKANAQHEVTLHYTARELPKREILSVIKFN